MRETAQRRRSPTLEPHAVRNAVERALNTCSLAASPERDFSFDDAFELLNYFSDEDCIDPFRRFLTDLLQTSLVSVKLGLLVQPPSNLKEQPDAWKHGRQHECDRDFRKVKLLTEFMLKVVMRIISFVVLLAKEDKPNETIPDLLQYAYSLSADALLPANATSTSSGDLTLTLVFNRAAEQLPHLLAIVPSELRGRYTSLFAALAEREPRHAADLRKILNSEPPTVLSDKISRSLMSQKIRSLLNKNSQVFSPSWLDSFLDKLNDDVIAPCFYSRGCYFGGSASGFTVGGSDLDICIPYPLRSGNDLNGGETPQDLQQQCCEELVGELLDDFKVKDSVVCIESREVIKARVPLVKCSYKVVWENDGEEDPRGDLQHVAASDLPFTCYTLKVDFVFDNLCGILNSRMLRMYSSMSPHVKNLGRFVKLWTKRRGLSRPPKNLSPYSWMILVVFFLQRHQNLPNLQQMPSKDLVRQWQAALATAATQRDKRKRPSERVDCHAHRPMEFLYNVHDVWHFDPLADDPYGPRVRPVLEDRNRLLESSKRDDSLTADKTLVGTRDTGSTFVEPRFRITRLPSRNSSSYSSRNGLTHYEMCSAGQLTNKFIHHRDTPFMVQPHRLPVCVTTCVSRSGGLSKHGKHTLEALSGSREKKKNCPCNEGYNFPRHPDRFHLATLVFDFFRFYATFDWFSNIVSIKGAVERERSSMLNVQSLSRFRGGAAENDDEHDGDAHDDEGGGNNKELCYVDGLHWMNSNCRLPYRFSQKLAANLTLREHRFKTVQELLRTFQVSHVKHHCDLDVDGDNKRNDEDRGLTPSPLKESHALNSAVLNIEDPFEEGRFLSPRKPGSNRFWPTEWSSTPQEHFCAELHRAVNLFTSLQLDGCTETYCHAKIDALFESLLAPFKEPWQQHFNRGEHFRNVDTQGEHSRDVDTLREGEAETNVVADSADENDTPNVLDNGFADMLRLHKLQDASGEED